MLKGVLVSAVACAGVMTSALAAWSEFPKDDAAAIRLATSETGSSLEAAHLLFLYNRFTKHNVKPPSPAIEAAYSKVRVFYDSRWSDGLTTQLEPREFSQILQFSFFMRPAFEKAHGPAAKYPLDFYKLLDKNSRALTAAQSRQAAFWLALTPCLDGGSGEVIASLLAQGMKKHPSAWIEALAPAQVLLQKESGSAGGVCGEGQEESPGASAVKGLHEVMQITLDRKRDAAVFERFRLEFDLRAEKALLASSGLASDSKEAKKLQAQIVEFRQYLR